MATDNNQVAISRPTRVSSTNASKSSRQAVPAFLQKLFEMVNDTKNQDLIRWSEAGDSFFVLDHERFAREVLGRWFKHQNFSSFVRQLNMYGFHKIPHLQQGVLRSEADTEYWNFAHANFRRGQPDLLCFIQRKRQSAQNADETVDVRDSQTASPPASLTQGQLLDMHSVLQGVAAIRRHQTTISTELNDLKQSNQLLWQESMDARTKLQKQQDTINRILKFLAGVFGNQAAGNHHKSGVADPANSPHNAVISRRRTRLMIEDAKRDPSGKVGIIEVEDPDAAEPLNSFHDAAGYAVDTPVSAQSPTPSVAQSEVMGPSITETNYHGSTNPSSLLATGDATRDNIPTPRPHMSSSTTSTSSSTFSQTKPQPVQSDTSTATHTTPQAQSMSALEHAVTPNRRPTYEIDPRVQSILNNLSPDQISNLFATLSQTIAETDAGRNPSDVSSSSQFTFPHMPSALDFLSGQPPPSPLPLPPATSTTDTGSDHAAGGLLSFDHNMSLSDHLSPRLDRHWEAAADIDHDVNAMNHEINNLIETLGPYFAELQPMVSPGGANDAAPSTPSTTTATTPIKHPTLGAPPSTSASARTAVPSLPDTSGTAHTDILSSLDPSTNNTSDFDFDAFLNTISNDSGVGTGTGMDLDGIGIGMGYGDELNGAETAFLDEVPSPAVSTSGPTVGDSPILKLRPISPLQMINSTPETSNPANAKTTGTAAGRKRKSDVMGDLEGALGAASVTDSRPANGAPSSKTKRRKD